MRLARLSPGEIVCSWNALSCQDVVIQLGFVQTTDKMLACPNSRRNGRDNLEKHSDLKPAMSKLPAN